MPRRDPANDHAAPLDAPLPPFGAPPEGASSWQIQRDAGGTWEPCFYFDPTTETRRKEWSIASLAPEVISERWGRGVYRIHWFGADRKKGGVSQQFQIEAPERFPNYPNDPIVVRKREAEASAARAVAAPDPLAMFERIYSQIRGDLERQAERMRLEMELTMARERDAHARELERSREFFATMMQMREQEAARNIENMRGAQAAITKGAAESQKALLAKLAELEEEIEDLREEAPAQAAQAAAAGGLDPTVALLLNKYGHVLEAALPKLLGHFGASGS